MDRLSIRTLCYLLIAITALSGVIISGFALQSDRLAQGAQADWRQYKTTTDPRLSAATRVTAAIGYGGMIHGFKNYILRGRPEDFQAAQRRAGALLESLDGLAVLDTPAEERAAISHLQDMVAAYNERLLIAQALVRQGATVEEIDAAAGYADEDGALALAAIGDVANLVTEDPLDERVRLLTSLHQALGFGGLIHRFKELVLRGDGRYAAETRASAARARRLIGFYRQLDLTAFERRDLDVVETMIAGYERRVSLVEALYAQGLNAAAVDAQVRLDDTAALAALHGLELAISELRASVAASLTTELAKAGQTARLAVIAIVTVSLVLATVIFLALFRVVIGRSQEITLALERLARGDQHVALSKLEANTEMGSIARAAKRFRDHSNEMLALKERMLGESQTRAASVLDATASAILSVNAQGRVDSANASANRLFQAATGALVGRQLSDIVRVQLPAGGEDLVSHLLNDAESERVFDDGVAALRPDGSTFPAQLSTGRFDEGGRRVLIISISDLSDRKAAEQMRLEITERKRVERLKSEFVSTVSHELRTPLTSIRGALGLMQASMLGDLPDKALQMVDIAYNNCDRLVRLINDILDIEKIEAGKFSFDFSRQSVADLLNRALAENQAYSQEFGVALGCGDVDETLQIDADIDRFCQVMSNLVSNAVKFSPQGGTVRIGAEQGKQLVRIWVSDDGPGIPDEFRTRIFQKFAQADSSDTRQVGGTGLGLSIARAIVDAHGGTIGFDSAPDSGTTFWFEIPLARTPSDTGTDPDERRPTVLVVEDDADIATLLEILLDRMGYNSCHAAHATAAKRMLAERKFVAMTLDMSMPDQDGTSLIRDLRESAVAHDVPVIVVSARQPHAKQELEGGAFSIIDWMEKPIEPERLRAAIAQAAQERTNDRPRILHIDDDPDHAAIVAQVAGNNAQLDRAATCGEARRMLTLHDYDIVVLDMLLPDGSGESLLPHIKANGAIPPQILVFSIMELPVELRAHVSTALLKSHTSNARLERSLTTLLAAAGRCRDATEKLPNEVSYGT